VKDSLIDMFSPQENGRRWRFARKTGQNLTDQVKLRAAKPESKVGGNILANLKSAIKRNRQNKKRRLRNRVYRGEARTFIRDARASMLEENLEEARVSTLKAVKALDKAAEKGVIHKNNAARRKSRLVKQLAALEKQNA
jgi:small subunit ribosomal protein S20